MGPTSRSPGATWWWTAQWWIDQVGIEEVSAAELGRKPVPYVMQTVQNQIGVPVDDA